jgi:hypothetical protein
MLGAQIIREREIAQHLTLFPPLVAVHRFLSLFSFSFKSWTNILLPRSGGH